MSRYNRIFEDEQKPDQALSGEIKKRNKANQISNFTEKDLKEGAKKLGDCFDLPYEKFIVALIGKTPGSKEEFAEINPKVEAVLNMGIKDLNIGDEKIPVETNASFKVKELFPTQSQIGMKDSIGYPMFVDPTIIENLLNTGQAKFVKNGVEERILVANGKWILDGHHRWSQTYLLDPEASIPAINITFKVDSFTEILKVIQAAISATYGGILIKPADAPTDIFDESKLSSQGGTYGLLKKIADSKEGDLPKGGNLENLPKFIDVVFKYKFEGSPSEDQSDETKKEKVLKYLAKNADILIKNNGKNTNSPTRAFMPQPDDTRASVGGEKKYVAGIPAEFIDKLQTGELNFKEPLLPGDKQGPDSAPNESRRYIKTYESFIRNGK